MNQTDTQLQTALGADAPPYHLTGEERSGELLLVCEHASAVIPESLGDLGLAKEHRKSHAVWDIGAESLSRLLSERLNAPLLTAGVSRLVIDLNRAPDASDAMPELVEDVSIPGNRKLSQKERNARADALYRPFHEALASMLDAMPAPVLVTVHSFTPTWKGQPRSTRIGLLHDANPDLALAMLAQSEGSVGTELNKPYSAADGVTHTLACHGTARGIPNVMIEVRNDLLGNETAIGEIADELLAMLVPALECVA